MAIDKPSFLSFPIKHPFVTLLGLVILVAFLRFQAFPGKGQVQDTVTAEPIRNATVRLTCSRPNLFHGSTTVREVEAVTGANGIYSFSIFDVFGCSDLTVAVSKDGYHWYCGWCPRHIHHSFGSIPKLKFLTKIQDLPTIRIQGVTPREKPDVPYNKSTYARYINLWYIGFIQAKHIAKTDQEIELVKLTFCATVSGLYEHLTIDEKEGLASRTFLHNWEGHVYQHQHDYENDVVRFCA